MADCLKCGMPYQEGAATCAHCGASLSEPIADGLAALQQLRQLDASRPTAQPDPDVSVPESVPDWLELLLARHGEETPDFVGPERSRSAPPSAPSSATPEPEPATVIPETEAPDLLAEIESLKAKVVPSPQPEAEEAETGGVVSDASALVQVTPAGAAGGESDASVPQAAADWLAALEETEAGAPAAQTAEAAAGATDAAAAAIPPAEPTEWQPRPERFGVAARTSSLLAGDVLPPVSDESLDWLAELRASRVSQSVEAAGEPTSPSAEAAEAEVAASEPVAPVEPPIETEPEGGLAVLPAGAVEEPVAEPASAPDSREWLNQLRQTKAEAVSPSHEMVRGEAEPEPLAEAVSVPSPAIEALPDWLAELERASAVAETAEPPPSAPPPEEMPDWLRDLGLAASPTHLPPTDAAAASATLGPLPMADAALDEVPEQPEVPEWLSRLVSGTVEAPASEPATAAASETVTPPGEAAATQVPPIPTADALEAIGAADLAPDEVPDWLRELEMIQTAPADVAPTAAWETPPAVAGWGEIEDEAPPWMDDLRPLRSLATGTADEGARLSPVEDAAETPAAMPEPEESLTPEWLAELQSLVESPPEVAPSAPAISTGPLPPGEPTPDWLRDLGGETRVAAAADEDGPAAEPGQLPDWLVKLKPAELDAIPGVERIPVAEVASSEPLSTEEDAIESLRVRLGMPRVPDVKGAALFCEIVSEPGTTPSEPPPQRNVLNTIIWVLIVIAILLGIAILSLAVMSRAQDVLGGSAFQRFLDSPAGGGLVAALDSFRTPLARLPDDAVVVMGIDYSPATEAEMRPLAEMTLRDLLAHRARVVTVSLRPEGAALAQQLLSSVSDAYPFGERTLNLGYLPGELAGLRSLAALGDLPLYAAPATPCDSLATCPAWEDVRTLEDVALVVEVADVAAPVRWWLEQLSTTPVASKPVLAAVSAAAAPEVRPYYSASEPGPARLQGVISGVTGAAAYELAMRQPGRAVRSIAAQSAAHLGLVVTALVGTFVGLRARVISD